MRRISLHLLALLLSLAFVLPAGAGIDPSAVVLRKADLPRGFVVDRSDTGLRTNEQEARNEPRLRALYERTRRVTGYEVEFDRHAAAVGARVDVFETAEGARIMLRWFGEEMRKTGIRGLMRSRASLGDEAWVYGGDRRGRFTIVAWRYGRVFSGVAGTGLPRARTLALARVQHARIVASLG